MRTIHLQDFGIDGPVIECGADEALPSVTFNEDSVTCPDCQWVIEGGESLHR